MATVISDSSPLVHLSAIARFGLLRQLYRSLLVPPAVWKEVTVAGKARPGAAELEAAVNQGWIKVQVPSPDTFQPPELAGLDEGESEAITLALETHAEVLLLDEIRGRMVARSLGLRAVGTLGVLAEAKRQGLVNSLREELTNLKNRSQFYISAELEQLALQLAGELPS